ncbi:MAG: hypothetical protein LC772_01435, partial [Chloroflexi bacterium]|nr:hypothetical protein [Chloroflexota bacterium]
TSRLRKQKVSERDIAFQMALWRRLTRWYTRSEYQVSALSAVEKRSALGEGGHLAEILPPPAAPDRSEIE